MADTSHLKLVGLRGNNLYFRFPGGTPDGSNEHWRRVYMDTFIIFTLGISNQIIGDYRETAAVEVFQDLAKERHRERASDSVEMQIDQRTWNKLFSRFQGLISTKPIPTFPWKIPNCQILSPSSTAYRAWREVLGLPCKVFGNVDPGESELTTRVLETCTVKDGREILQVVGHAKYFKGFGGEIRDKKFWHKEWHKVWFKAAMMSSNNRSSSTPKPSTVENPFSEIKNPFAPVSPAPPMGEKRKIGPKEDEPKGDFKVPKTSASTTKPGFLAPTFNQPDTISPASYSLPTAAPGLAVTNSNSMAKEPGTIQGHQVIGLNGPSVSKNSEVGGLFGPPESTAASVGAPPTSTVSSVGGLFGPPPSTAASVGASPTSAVTSVGGIFRLPPSPATSVGGLFGPPPSTVSSVGGLFGPPPSTLASEDAGPPAPAFEDGAGTRKLPNFSDSPPIHKTLVNCWEALSKSKYWIKSRMVTAAFEIRLPDAKITDQLLPTGRIVTSRHSSLFQIERRGVTDDDLCLGINLCQHFARELSEAQMDILRDTWRCIVRWVTFVCQGAGIEFTKWCFLWSRNLCPLMDNHVSEQQTWVWLERNEKTTSIELVKSLPRESDCQFAKEISEKISKIINEHKSSEDNEGLLQAVSSAVLAEKVFSNPRSRLMQALMIAVYSIATSKFETESFSEAQRLYVLIREGHPTLQIT
ncbi:unnamed protein product [Clonostachys rhizophaga]|uniref:Uncharacterized protein n=1 Tax=Clonostachys rhizophaga TaxID=160324 RepID=A0A9N9V2E8_9HYPO|nr:unnamed protein product [Clonostachys rhizophaga]